MKGRWSLQILPIRENDSPCVVIHLHEARTRKQAEVQGHTRFEEWRDSNSSYRTDQLVATLNYVEEIFIPARAGDCLNCDDPGCRGCNRTR